jgi:Flp pilus assembly protein TadG
MQKIFNRLRKEESGQSLVMVVLLLSILLGFSALIVDVGLLYTEKAKLQNAADAAALAGAQFLPNKTLAEGFVETYANSNGVPTLNISEISYPSVDNKKIKVDVESEVPYIFASFLNLVGTSTTVSASATALVEYRWDGEALPLVNTGDEYKSEKIILRTNKSPGDKSQLFDFYKKTSSSGMVSYYVQYSDGIILDEGNGNTESNIDNKLKLNTVLADIFQNVEKGNTFYLLSIKSSILDGFMNKNQAISVIDKDGTTQTRTEKNGGFKGGDVIDESMLVLLEVAFEKKKSNDTEIEMNYIREYDIFNGDYPLGDENSTSTTSKLIE